MSKEINMMEMLKAGVHFGHKKSKLNPKMKPFVYGLFSEIHIIDLAKTQELLEKALDFIKEIVSKKGVILFIGTARQAKSTIEEAARACGMPYVVNRWLGGTFTNFNEISKSVNNLKDLELKKKKGEFQKYTKKEQLEFDRVIEKLQKLVGGIKEMSNFPQAIFATCVEHDKLAIKEAKKVGIPVIALVDTDADPTLIDWPIPANDDAISSIKMMVDIVSDAINKAKK